MAIEQVTDSVRRIIKRWCATNTPLIVDAIEGDTEVQVKTTVRFRVGEEVLLRQDGSNFGEMNFYIEEITGDHTLVLSRALSSSFFVSNNTVVEKLYHHQFLQGVYIGEPQAIPKYPAITVMPRSRHSEWLTIDSTREEYNIEVTVYVQDTNQEDAMRFLMQMTDTIQFGLKRHIYPLVGPYATTAITQDIGPGDTIIKVADSSIFTPGELHRLMIEDPWYTTEHMVSDIIDSTTIRLDTPTCYAYSVADNTQVIYCTRFIYNSWPSDIEYGTVYTGTMLKAARINWFAWEEDIHTEPPVQPSIL